MTWLGSAAGERMTDIQLIKQMIHVRYMYIYIYVCTYYASRLVGLSLSKLVDAAMARMAAIGREALKELPARLLKIHLLKCLVISG